MFITLMSIIESTPFKIKEKRKWTVKKLKSAVKEEMRISSK